MKVCTLLLEINTNNKLEILNIRSLYPNSWRTQLLIYGVIIWNDLGLHDEIKKNISNFNLKNKPSNNICVVRLMAESRHFLSSTNLCQSTLLYCLLPYQCFIHSSSTFSRAYSADKSQLKIVCARFPPVAKAMIANKQNNPFKSTRSAVPTFTFNKSATNAVIRTLLQPTFVGGARTLAQHQSARFIF